MVERIKTLSRKKTKIESPFKYCNPKRIERFETIEDPISINEIFVKLRENVLDGKRMTDEERFLTNAVYPYEILRAVNDTKVELSCVRDYDKVRDCLDAQQLAVNYCLSAYRNEDRIKKSEKLLALQAFLETSQIASIMSQRVVETPDPDIMPKDPLGLVLEKAKEIHEKAKEKDILAIVLCDRGWRLGLGIFQAYSDLYGSKDSKVWPVRYSLSYMPIDTLPRLDTIFEMPYIKDMGRNRQIVVIGTSDRIEKGASYFTKMGFFEKEQNWDMIKVSLPVERSLYHRTAENRRRYDYSVI